jgi:hypothetical protein
MCGCEAITCEGCPCGCGHTKDTRISALMREVDDIKVHSPKEEPVVDSLEEIDWQKGFIKRIIERSCEYSQHNGEQSCVCDVIDEELSELIALVRADDARQLRESPKYIISEADECGYEQCNYCYPELVLDENGKVIKIEDVEKLADEWEWK